MVNIVKNVLIMIKKYATNVFTTASKRAIQKKKKKKKRADETDDLIGNRNDNKVIGVSKTSQQNNPELVTKERNQEISKGRYISPEKRQKVIDDMRLR